MASLKTEEHAHIRIGNAEAAVWGLEQSCPAASIEHGDGYSWAGARRLGGLLDWTRTARHCMHVGPDMMHARPVPGPCPCGPRPS